MIPPPSEKLSNMQLLLLKVFSRPISEEEVLEIRSLLANYFLNKVTKEADRIWDERGFTPELMEQWLHEKS